MQVVGLLSESVAETLRSFYRLRTAYKTLEGIHTAISAIPTDDEVGTSTPASRRSTESDSARSSKAASTVSGAGSKKEEGITMGKASSKASVVSLRKTKSRMARDEVEVFTRSGCALCFGLLLLLLGMVPPSLGRVMSIVGFRGGREYLDFLSQVSWVDRSQTDNEGSRCSGKLLRRATFTVPLQLW